MKEEPESPLSPLTPHLVIDGAAEAIEFYKRAFGAQELMRLPAPNGKLMHACVLINGATVMLMDEKAVDGRGEDCGVTSPQTLKGTPVTLHLMVEDADTVIAEAEKAGARVVMPATDMFWGDRYGVVDDPFGHRWALATPIRQVSVEEMQAAMLAPAQQPSMQYDC